MKKILYLSFAVLVAMPQNMLAKESSWSQWLGIGAAALGVAAFVTSLIPEKPEATLERCTKIFHTEHSRFAGILERFERTTVLSREELIAASHVSLYGIASSVHALQRCVKELNAVCDKLSADVINEECHLKFKCVQRIQALNRLIDRMQPLSIGYGLYTLEHNYMDLYNKFHYSGDLYLHIRYTYGHFHNPFITYKKELDHGLSQLQTYRAALQDIHHTIIQIRYTDARWYDHIERRVNHYIQHCTTLRHTLLDMRAWVTSTPEYYLEQERIERERLEKELRDHKEWLKQRERLEQKELQELKQRVRELESSSKRC